MDKQFVVCELIGQRMETVESLGTSPRGSAALAKLIDWLATLPGEVTPYPMHDLENPGCYDIMVDFGGNLRQFAIEERKQ